MRRCLMLGFPLLSLFTACRHPPAEFARIDPNCNAQVVEMAPIANRPNPNNNMRHNATEAIAGLDFADIWGGARPIAQVGNMRLDKQNAMGQPFSNLQVQINGMPPPSTVAHSNVQATLQGASTAARQRYVERLARQALNRSLETGNRFDVQGTCN